MSEAGTSSVSTGGIGVVGALGIAFVVLKLCGVINWSWWLVTLPFWGPALLGFTILIVGLVALAVGVAITR